MARGSQLAGAASLARRHFVAAASAAVARGVALGGLATLLLSSAGAEAAPKKPKKDRAQCFLRGTHILKSDREARVEELRIGDLVRTVRGGSSRSDGSVTEPTSAIAIAGKIRFYQFA